MNPEPRTLHPEPVTHKNQPVTLNHPGWDSGRGSMFPRARDEKVSAGGAFEKSTGASAPTRGYKGEQDQMDF